LACLTRKVFRVDRRDIAYFRFTLESYSGMAMVTTLDPGPALVAVLIAPGCEETVLEVIEALRQEEGLPIDAQKEMHNINNLL